MALSLNLIERKDKELHMFDKSLFDLFVIQNNRKITSVEIDYFMYLLKFLGLCDSETQNLATERLVSHKNSMNSKMKIYNYLSFEEYYIKFSCFKLTLLGGNFLRYIFPDIKLEILPSFNF